MPQLAQHILVERFLSWERIRNRLGRFGHIRRAYPLALLQRHRDTPPYFCHYMAWRLGTWNNERLLERFDHLLGIGEALPGWANEHPMLENPDFSVYWSLLWQLQMAEHLSSVGTAVEWNNPGPDLAVTIDGTRIYVECFVLRKSFGIRLFLQEVLQRLGPDIRLDHDYCLRLDLPQNQGTSQFLNTALSPFLDEDAIHRLRAEAQRRYPVVVCRPASTLVIFIEGTDVSAYDPTIHSSVTGDPEQHLRVILSEALAQKVGANALTSHRPNLVAVNYLLSTDAQVAMTLSGLPPCPSLPDGIDGFAVAPAVGIDDCVTRERLLLLASRERVLNKIGAAP